MKNKTLIWAVDPLDSETKPTKAAVQGLSRWAREGGFRLQPVFVMPVPMESLERGSLAAVDEAENLLRKFVGSYGLEGLLPPALLLDESNTRSGAVRKLLAYAKKEKAAAVSLSSHGRAGLKRFVFGSFAEQLLRESPVPVLFLAKEMQASRRPVALFSTDFSDFSRKAFKKFLAIAEPLKMEIVLFHAISLPAPGFGGMAAGIPSAYIPENYFPGEEARARKESAAWIKLAKSAGVSARLLLSDRGIGILTGDVILAAADRTQAELLVIATMSSPVEHLVFGSAALEVFRANRLPVWAFGPKAMAAPKQREKAKAVRPPRAKRRQLPQGRERAR